MKKIALLCAIVCASQLYGMNEPSSKPLLLELKQKIIQTALETAKNPKEAIEIIKKTSAFHNVQFDNFINNLRIFTAIVNLLAEKFNMNNMAVVFNLPSFPVTTQWHELGKKLYDIAAKDTTDKNNFDEFMQLIEQGADVNYSLGGNTPLTSHLWVAPKLNLPLIKILIDKGARVNQETLNSVKEKAVANNPKHTELIAILEEAIKKQQK